MNDRELLKAAANAAGITNYEYCELVGGSPALYCREGHLGMWAPLIDDGDCARLEVACAIELSWSQNYGVAARQQRPAHRPANWHGETFESHNGDRNAARRRASVRAAASLSKEKDHE